MLTDSTQVVSNVRPPTTSSMDCSSARDLRTACVPPELCADDKATALEGRRT
jgi:hypothetical protein